MSKDKLLKTTHSKAATCHKGGLYRIKSERTELPLGATFSVIPVAVASGDLICTEVSGRIIVGRWLPDIAGFDWILQPGRLIRVTGRVPFRILGVMAPYPSHLNPGGFNAC